MSNEDEIIDGDGIPLSVYEAPKDQLKIDPNVFVEVVREKKTADGVRYQSGYASSGYFGGFRVGLSGVRGSSMIITGSW